MSRLAAAAVLTSLVAVACGSVGEPGGATDSAAPATPTPTSGTPAAVVTTAPPVSLPPTPTASPAAPSRVPTPPLTMPMMAVTTSVHALRALVGGGPQGSVTTITQPDGAHLHAVITGLTPGSTHAVHEHLGSCATANTTTHLAVLTVAVADAAGVISFDSAVSRANAGAGRIVIVYLSSRPNLIVACADL